MPLYRYFLDRHLFAVTFALFLFAATPARLRAQDPKATATTALATVDGEVIAASDWINRMQSLTINDLNASPRTRRFTAGQLALDLLINEKAVLAYAAKTRLLPAAAELDAEINAQKLQPVIKERLESKSLTEEQLRRALRYEMTLNNFLTINQIITEEEIRAFYDVNFGPRWQLALIRIGSQESAKKAYAELQAGTAFSKVAETYSDDLETRKIGGELRGADGQPRLFAATDSGLPPFIVEAVKKLNRPGDYSPLLPASANGGQPLFFIVQLVGRVSPPEGDYAKRHDAVKKQAILIREMRTGRAEQKILEARRDLKITLNVPGFEAILH